LHDSKFSQYILSQIVCRLYVLKKFGIVSCHAITVYKCPVDPQLCTVHRLANFWFGEFLALIMTQQYLDLELDMTSSK